MSGLLKVLRVLPWMDFISCIVRTFAIFILFYFGSLSPFISAAQWVRGTACISLHSLICLHSCIMLKRYKPNVHSPNTFMQILIKILFCLKLYWKMLSLNKTKTHPAQFAHIFIRNELFVRKELISAQITPLTWAHGQQTVNFVVSGERTFHPIIHARNTEKKSQPRQSRFHNPQLEIAGNVRSPGWMKKTMPTSVFFLAGKELYALTVDCNANENRPMGEIPDWFGSPPAWPSVVRARRAYVFAIYGWNFTPWRRP